MNKGIIYKVVNQVNNKIYIGLTTQIFSKRKASHIYMAMHNKDNLIFHNAIKRYGIDVFEWSVIWEGNKSLLSQMEIFYIQKYKSYFKTGHGYNMTFGGEGNSGFKGKDSPAYKYITYTFYHPNKTTEKDITYNDMYTKYNLSPSALSSVISGRLQSIKYWSLNKPSKKIIEAYEFKNKKIKFYHKSGIKEFLTRYALCKKYDLQPSAIKLVIENKRPMFKNWFINPNLFNAVNRNHLYSFIHSTGLKEINITRTNFIKKYNLNESCVLDLCKGSQNTHRKWKLLT